MNKTNKKLNRVALVTGGNRGLGLEICRQLSRIGFTVLLTSRNSKKGIRAAEILREEGGNIFFYELDVVSQKSINKLKRFILKKFKKLDVLINNAGIMLDHRNHKRSKKISIYDASMKSLISTMHTNVFGPFMMCKSFIPVMKKNNYGRIVNISSKAGQLSRVSKGVPMYRLSKVSLNGVTRIFSDERNNKNILINSVCPGWVKTSMGGPNALLEPAKAIRTIIWLATLGNNGPTGGFFSEKIKIKW